MKAKVIKKFKDIHTGKIHKVGEIMNVEEKRFEEILSKGEFVEEVEEKGETKPEIAGKSEMMGVHLSKDDLANYTVKELKELASDMKLATKGTKDELIERICSEEVYVDPEILETE